jgi:hypothetical protein
VARVARRRVARYIVVRYSVVEIWVDGVDGRFWYFFQMRVVGAAERETVLQVLRRSNGR